LSELEELLVEKDKFELGEVKEMIDEFTEVFDVAYTYSPITNQLMTQNFEFVRSVNCLIKYVNNKKDREEPNEHVTYGHYPICRNIC
jgi:hypothetical protein